MSSSSSGLPFPELCAPGSEFVQTESGPFCYSTTDKRPLQCPPEAITTPLQGGGIVCTGPEGNVNKQCPTGYRLYYQFDPSNPTGGEECRKATPATCPSGTTLHEVFKKGVNGQPEGGPKQVCVPNTTPSYSRPAPTPGSWPCDGNDLAAPDGSGGIKCFGSGTSGSVSPSSSSDSSAPAPGVRGGDYNDLRNQYSTQVQEYNALIDEALRTKDAAKLPVIRDKAAEIEVTLNKMVEALTYLKKETPDIRTERDILLEKLRRIQNDYNALLSGADELETLRRIRKEEGGEARRQLYLYLAFFFGLSCVMLLIVLFMSRRQNTDSAATIARTPAINPALT